jgi:hypothetical protein
MTSEVDRIYVPSAVGRAALHELDRVAWAELEHAYGTGVIGPELYEDVPATLRQLGETDPAAFHEGVDALFSNLCHQGTIFQATAFAVPFLAALAAGLDLTPAQSHSFVGMLMSIGVAASFEAPNVSHSGACACGPGVAPLTRQAFRVSDDLLASAARRNPDLHDVAAALAAMVQVEPPDPDAVERLEILLERLMAEADSDEP